MYANSMHEEHIERYSVAKKQREYGSYTPQQLRIIKRAFFRSEFIAGLEYGRMATVLAREQLCPVVITNHADRNGPLRDHCEIHR
jgi:hypothetical protein